MLLESLRIVYPDWFSVQIAEAAFPIMIIMLLMEKRNMILTGISSAVITQLCHIHVFPIMSRHLIWNRLC